MVAIDSANEVPLDTILELDVGDAVFKVVDWPELDHWIELVVFVDSVEVCEQDAHHV